MQTLTTFSAAHFNVLKCGRSYFISYNLKTKTKQKQNKVLGAGLSQCILNVTVRKL